MLYGSVPAFPALDAQSDLLLLLLLSHFSHVRLFATPRIAAHQAPPPMGFFRQEYWSGVPLPSPAIALGKHQFVADNIKALILKIIFLVHMSIVK